jgi:peptidoglycan/LPS O-acetylase OafA/YrhL
MKYEPSLDRIRAIAISSVVIYHATAQRILPGGWAGVDIFFVLSEYLITRLLIEELEFTKRIDFKKFYMRRILRLAPAFLVLLIAQLILSNFAKDIIESATISATYLMNWNRAFRWIPQGILGHTWSLSMDEQFYILWRALMLLLYRRRPLLWISLAIVSIASWRSFLALDGSDPERTYNGFDTHADALMIGCAMAVVKFKPWFLRMAVKFAVVPISVMIYILLDLQHRTVATQTIVLERRRHSASMAHAGSITERMAKIGVVDRRYGLYGADIVRVVFVALPDNIDW